MSSSFSPVGDVRCPASHLLYALQDQSHTLVLPLPLAVALAQLSAFVSVLLCPMKLGPYSPHPTLRNARTGPATLASQEGAVFDRRAGAGAPGPTHTVLEVPGVLGGEGQTGLCLPPQVCSPALHRLPVPVPTNHAPWGWPIPRSGDGSTVSMHWGRLSEPGTSQDCVRSRRTGSHSALCMWVVSVVQLLRP